MCSLKSAIASGFEPQGGWLKILIKGNIADDCNSEGILGAGSCTSSREVSFFCHIIQLNSEISIFTFPVFYLNKLHLSCR
jgi:hypothetical protein